MTDLDDYWTWPAALQRAFKWSRETRRRYQVRRAPGGRWLANPIE